MNSVILSGCQMSEKKFQVFISSTYEDLKDERRAVEETIIRSGDFPVGMEAFPAADEEQFEFIKSIISQCDYYVLIIAGRYGSMAPDGKSYTEKEYEYAVEVGVPVLVMLRENLTTLPALHYERDPEKLQKLTEFISLVSHGRLRKGWSTIDGLKLSVREALDYAKATKKRPGWIKGDQSASTEMLERLIVLQVENEKLRAELNASKPTFLTPPNIAGLEKSIRVLGTYMQSSGAVRRSDKVRLNISSTIGEVFELIAPHLLLPQPDYSVGALIARSIFQRYNAMATSAHSFILIDEVYQTLKIQLMALGLVSINPSGGESDRDVLLWSLTEKGKQEMVMRRALLNDLEDPE